MFNLEFLRGFLFVMVRSENLPLKPSFLLRSVRGERLETQWIHRLRKRCASRPKRSLESSGKWLGTAAAEASPRTEAMP